MISKENPGAAPSAPKPKPEQPAVIKWAVGSYVDEDRVIRPTLVLVEAA